MLDSLQRGEAPYASHLLYPQVFDDLDKLERSVGMAAGHYDWRFVESFLQAYRYHASFLQIDMTVSVP